MAAETILATAQTGNGDSAVATRFDTRAFLRPGALVITSVIGATPTVTVNILGSPGGVNYFNVPYALVGTPGTFVVSPLTITTAVTTIYLLQANQPWAYLKLNLSANTNVTIDAKAYL